MRGARGSALILLPGRLYICPVGRCRYRSCLLGVVAHALAKHRINLLAKSHKQAPTHKHHKNRYETVLRYVYPEAKEKR